MCVTVSPDVLLLSPKFQVPYTGLSLNSTVNEVSDAVNILSGCVVNSGFGSFLGSDLGFGAGAFVLLGAVVSRVGLVV